MRKICARSARECEEEGNLEGRLVKIGLSESQIKLVQRKIGILYGVAQAN